MESISTEDRQIVLHFNNARELNKSSLAQDFKSGIKLGSQQIKLDIKLLGNIGKKYSRRCFKKWLQIPDYFGQAHTPLAPSVYGAVYLSP